MLQQNNNNNYPCLSGLDSTPEMLQKCSRTSLPFSRALELGLADLPLIRGLRAWALCSKNRRKAGGVLGGGQAPITSLAGHRSSTTCPRPADVYLSREWGHMAYGLPFGPDAGQAGIRALVTVASLKTSEGSGKTQTQCLFLQTEKGSCLYSAGKPGFGGSSNAASSGVGGWLKGKTGATGCKETPVRQRDQGPTPVADSGANHAGVRSGRRWRKSCNAARKEKKGVSRGGQQRWREDPAAEIPLDERQEEQDNGGLEGKQFPSPQHTRRIRQEKVEALQSPGCCHETSSSGCIQCGGKAQRRDSPTRSTSTSDTQPQRKLDDHRRRIYELDSTGSVFSSVSDLETYRFPPESHSNSDIIEIMGAKSEEKLNTQNDGYSEKEDPEAKLIKALTSNSCEQAREDLALRCNTWENVISEEKAEEGMKSLDVGEEGEKFTQISAEFLVVSNCGEGDFVCNPSLCARAELSHKNRPPEGSDSSVGPKSLVRSDREHGKECLNECEQAVAEYQTSGEEELGVNTFDQQEQHSAAVQDNTVAKSSEPLRLVEGDKNSSLLDDSDVSIEAILETDRTVTAVSCGNFSTTVSSGAEQQGEVTWEKKEEDLQEGNIEQRETPEKGGEDVVSEYTIHDLEDNGVQKDNSKEVTENGALKDSWRLPLSAEKCRINEETPDTFGKASRKQVGANSEISANVSHAAYTDLSTSVTPSRANPAHFLPLLESMTTDLPVLEVEKEEKEEQVRLLLRGGSQEGKRSPRRELEEPSEEERGYAVASQKDSKDEDEEDEEDEFGIFMQAEGESAWSEGLTMPASVPCGSSESVGECCGF